MNEVAGWPELLAETGARASDSQPGSLAGAWSGSPAWSGWRWLARLVAVGHGGGGCVCVCGWWWHVCI